MSQDSSTTKSVHRGACLCKAITYQVIGPPILSAYCHCTLCQRFTGCPSIHTIHFTASAFSWTHPQPHTGSTDTFSVPDKPWKHRHRCKICGSTVASYNSKLDKWSVWGGQLERRSDGKIEGWDQVKPTAHIFYETRMLDVEDNLGKWAGYEGISHRIA